jgi:hypothetical protein
MSPVDPETVDLPHSKSDFDLAAFERQEAIPDQTDPGRASQAEFRSDRAGDLVWTRSIDFLEEMKREPHRRTTRQSPGRAHPHTGAKRRGALSFNVYNWDFAPYMLAMKREVESHLFPPYAFTHMGAISGTNVVRFIVLRDGRVRDLVVLDSDAHGSLDLTSLRAIEMSLPFMPLPSSFPEEYLEVTAHFAYVVDR